MSRVLGTESIFLGFLSKTFLFVVEILDGISLERLEPFHHAGFANVGIEGVHVREVGAVIGPTSLKT
jgi:hypothetical protein